MNVSLIDVCNNEIHFEIRQMLASALCAIFKSIPREVEVQSNFIEITHRHGCSPVNLLYIFRALFLKNTSGWLLLNFVTFSCFGHFSFSPFWYYSHSFVFPGIPQVSKISRISRIYWHSLLVTEKRSLGIAFLMLIR